MEGMRRRDALALLGAYHAIHVVIAETLLGIHPSFSSHAKTLLAKVLQPAAHPDVGISAVATGTIGSDLGMPSRKISLMREEEVDAHDRGVSHIRQF